MPTQTVALKYDPFLLPTTQHRAGLSGLLILIDTMRRRRLAPLPETKIDQEGVVTIQWTRPSMIAVFNELYDASFEEIRQKNPRSGQKPVRILNQKGDDGKTQKIFVYKQLTPRAAFLKALGVPYIWIKLWREAVWGTLRGIPKTRIPYEERASRKSVSEAVKTWDLMVKFTRDLNRGKLRTGEITSALMPGCQVHTADQIPVLGRIDENLLLHFWPICSMIFQPIELERTGSERHRGYLFAVPDVADLDWFIREFPAVAASLEPEPAGFRPRGSIIGIPQEGGLEFARNLMAIAAGKARRKSGDILRGVEVYHVEKVGNNIKIWTADRVPVAESILRDYEAVRRRYFNAIFRRQLVLNLLRRHPWYRGFDRVFSVQPQELFFEETPSARMFRRDVRERFSVEFGGAKR